MAWRSLLLAFLAGYGLMNLLLWLVFGLWRWWGRPCMPSVLLLAKGDGERLEGITRALYDLQQRGRLAEVVVIPGEKEDELARRLAEILPGIKVLPAATPPDAALTAVQGASIWLLDLTRLPRGTPLPVPFPPPFLFGQKRKVRPEGYRTEKDE
ncbi:MAG: hypothetical protein GX493_03660 [Firmicutes bacterium]|nr:hypothetical protein [Bacillota bacterium]